MSSKVKDADLWGDPDKRQGQGKKCTRRLALAQGQDSEDPDEMPQNTASHQGLHYLSNIDTKIGWFYHAPARRNKSEEPTLYPPMSQIPGLTDNEALPPDDDQPRPLFRDTDTKYIRLAKEGGRRNLLYMKENPSEKREAVGYPRNDWFYLYDNELEDAEEKKKKEEEYAFLRPDYMVHEPYKQDESDAYQRPQRGPLGYDRLSVFERDGHPATDKTVKLPEVRKVGYGVRSEKPLKIPKTKQVGKPPSAQTDPGRGTRPLKYLPMPSAGKSRERPRIGKLLSYAYDREWFEDLAEWQTKQDSNRDKHKQMLNVPPHLQTEKPVSEYAVSYGKMGATKGQQPSHGEGAMSQRSADHKSHTAAPVRQTETQKLREAKLKKPEEKEMFKMTRFKNVPARIETHRHSAHHQAVQQQPQAAC